MAKRGYKLTLHELERVGNIEKLEHDGFNRHDVHDVLYKNTDGAPHRLREDIISKLYDRRDHKPKGR